MHVHLITIEICVVGCAHTCVESECTPFVHLHSVSHDRLSVQGGLSVEQHDIVVPQVTLNQGTDLQFVGEFLTNLV